MVKGKSRATLAQEDSAVRQSTDYQSRQMLKRPAEMREPPPLYPYLASNTHTTHPGQHLSYPHLAGAPEPALSRNVQSANSQLFNPFLYPTHDPSYLHAGHLRPLSGNPGLYSGSDSSSTNSRGGWSQSQSGFVDLGTPRRDLPYSALPAHYSPSFPTQSTAQSQSIGAQAGEKRPRSGNSEVEAGLALAGMGSSMSGNSMEDVAVKTERGEVEDDSHVKRKGGKKVKTGVPDEEKPSQPQGTVAKKSCAECRRMKAKCDRVFPCSNCRKRGCALACPDQDLSCMQGKRLVLASTEQLHERITELETALAHAHQQSAAHAPHPLLSADHIDGASIQRTPPLEHANLKAEKDDGRNRSPAQLSSSSGSYVVHTPVLRSESFGETPQQGRMAVESLLIDENQVGMEGKKDHDWAGENAAPALIIGNTGGSSADSKDRQALLFRLRSIVRVLPDRETTRRQANKFWSQSTWYQNILRRDEFENIYEPSVYAPTPSNPLTPHKLACVLMLLTLDTYLDVTGSQENPLVGEYWDAVQKCFDTSFGWGASVAGVQALGLASLFVGFGWRGAGASNFYWLRQMTSAAQQLGLHKDPPPSLPVWEQTFRRRVFHEMYTMDCLMSINHGQRTAIPNESIETKYPEDNMPRCRLKYQYMVNVKSRVIEIGCVAESISKEDLEQRVHKLSQTLELYGVQTSPDLHCPVLSGQAPPSRSQLLPSEIDVETLTRCTSSMCHFKSLMFLHRPSLRRLINRLRSGDKSTLSDAERNCIQQTVLASTSIIAISGFFAKYEPRLAARLWSTWVQTFSAAVSLAALAIWCGPYMDEGFVRGAYEEMRGGCEMIRKHGCTKAQGVLSSLPILCGLVESRYPALTAGTNSIGPAIQQGEDMLYVLLGGQVETPIPSIPEPIPAQPQPITQSAIPYPHENTQSSMPTLMDPALITWNDQISFGPSDTLPSHWLQMPNHLTSNFSLSDPHLTAEPVFPIGGDGQDWLHGADPGEVWARLQTFYEPAIPVPFWMGGMGVGGGGFEQGVGVGSWADENREFGL